MQDGKIRVLIVEDSAVNQKLLKSLLTNDPRFEIAGIAENGKQAIEMVEKECPDVVSMDLFMPVMDGVQATTHIMQHSPVPIVIVSSFFNPSEVQMSFRILQAGALAILPKPYGPGHPQFEETSRKYRNTLKMLSEVRVSPLRRTSRSSGKGLGARPETPEIKTVASSEAKGAAKPGGPFEVLAIGASAGGPQAASLLLSLLPASLRFPIMMVQHIDRNFAGGYTEWLSGLTSLPVVTASHGQEMLPGHVYLPPGDTHLGLIRKGVISLSGNPPEKGHRPAVSFLFRNILHVYGKNTISVMLSGMGSDGAFEMKMLHSEGALTIAQDMASSLVHGMPGEVIRMGGARIICNPEEIAYEIIKINNKIL